MMCQLAGMHKAMLGACCKIVQAVFNNCTSEQLLFSSQVHVGQIYGNLIRL